MPTQYIDLEPTWEAQCHMVERGALPATALMQACKAADIIRQALKSGKAAVHFTFVNGEVKVTVDDAPSTQE